MRDKTITKVFWGSVGLGWVWFRSVFSEHRLDFVSVGQKNLGIGMGFFYLW